MVYFLTLQPSLKKDKEVIIDNNCTEFSSSGEYVTYLENKLESVISSLNGVGNVQVIVSLEKGFEYIYQTEEETRTLTNGTSVTNTKVVLVDGKPIIIEEIYPVIEGIVIVAQGSQNVAVRMDIISLIQTIIDLDTSQIKILEGK